VFFRSYSAESINGWSDVERSEHTMVDLTHPDDVEIVKQLLAEVLTKPGAPILSTYRIKHRLGHYIWMEALYTNMLDDVHINAIVCNFRDVTEKKKADEEIRKKTEQIENILERITDGFVAIDNTFHFTYANKKICDMVGLPAGSLIGKYVWDAFPDSTGSETYNAFNKAFAGQQYVCYEDYYPPTKLWQENHIYPSPDGLSIFVKNITERKKNEKQIKEASETQEAILNALPAQIALLNQKGKIIAVNESWRKFALQNNLGLPHFGVGYNYLAISEKATGMDKVSANKISQGIRNVIAGNKKIYSMEYDCGPLTEKRCFQVQVSPIADKSHKGVVILHMDITDRKLTEESLLRSEANLRSVFENTDLSIILFNSQFKTISFNNNARHNMLRNLGVKLEKSKNLYNYFPKERRPVIKEAIDKAKNNEMVSYETKYKFLDGSFEWYEVKWVGVVNRKMENIGMILTFNNITDKKSADIEREKIVAELVRRNKDLEQFTYIISHNLRAPVANIIGLAHLTRDYEIRDKELREILESMSASVKNLDDVIIDLNNTLQIGNNGNEQIQKVNFTDIIGDIKHSINHLLKKESVTIITNFDEAGSFLTLRSYLYSIFYNLIINSIKYRQPDVPPVITISTSISNNRLILSYADNGKGIDLKKNGRHIFGLYKRFDFTVEGKGMGLFMVKIQVENLGGTISVKSEINKGAEFIMEFANYTVDYPPLKQIE